MILLIGTLTNCVPISDSGNPLREKLFSAGYAHNCLIENNDSVACVYSPWFTPFDDKFKDITADSLKAKAVSAGYAHTCVITLDDTVQCWNDNRKLVVEVGGDHDEPRTGFAAINNKKVLDIAAGPFHTCALKADNNEVECWGDNTRNQITRIKKQFAGTKLKAISAGNGLCGITMNDTAMCSDHVSSAGFYRFRGQKLKLIKAYSNYACALTTNNSLICWGDLPQEIANIYDNEIHNKKVRKLALGSEHICFLSAKDNLVHCAGFDGYGQINPTKLAEANTHQPVNVFLGAFHTCVVANTGAISCFGFDATLPHIKDMTTSVMKILPDEN